MNKKPYLFLISLLAFSLLLTSSVHPQSKFINRSFCVFSPVGKSGPITNTMNKFKVSAMQWGVRLNLKIYSDEIVALEDFQSGQCDAVFLSDQRTRKLVRFAGGFSQAGALPSFKHARKAIAALARPKAEKYMKNKKYEVAAVLPVGKVYLFARPNVLRDAGSQLTLDDIAGKRFGILSYDEQSRAAAKRLGTSVVNSDITNLFGKFNNGSVDIIYSTASAYKPMELYKGLGEDGRILKEPVLAFMTFQVTVHRDRFPEDFGLKARKRALKMFDFTKRMAMSYRSKVPNEYWLNPPDSISKKARKILKELRQDFTEKGVYDPRMTKMFRNIRCNINPDRAECI